MINGFICLPGGNFFDGSDQTFINISCILSIYLKYISIKIRRNMKKLFNIIAAISILVTFNFPAFSQTDTVTILSVNDTHSNLTPLAPRTADLQGTRGGIARAATLIGMTRLTAPEAIVLHAGDSFIGDISFNYSYGVGELSLLKGIGFDAMTLGNHEFDLTSSNLKLIMDGVIGGVNIPYLSANADFTYDTSGLSKYVFPYIIKQVGSSKIGIIGLTTPDANLYSSPSPVYIDPNIGPLTFKLIDSLKAKGCRAIVVLSHLGLDADKLLAAGVPGINLIIGGHDHYYLPAPVFVNNPLGTAVPIIQSDAFYAYMGMTKLAVSATGVKFIGFSNIPLDSKIPEDPSVKAILDNMIPTVEAKYGNVFTKMVGYASEDFEEVPTNLYIDGSHETAVGNLASDAFRWKTGTQIAIEPGGATAQKLFKGPVVAADIFRMVGYGFNTVNGLGYRIITFKLTGLEIWTLFEKAITLLGLSDEFLPQVSGMKYSFNLNNPLGSKMQMMLINGKPISFDSTYSITSSEMLIKVVSNPLFNVQLKDLVLYPDQTEFQVITEYVSTHSPLIPRRDGSVITVPVELASFTAAQKGSAVELLWMTKTETNNKGFEVEKKNADNTWTKIAFIAGHGTTAQQNSYSFCDYNAGLNNTACYYRLKQIDYDGTCTYSGEVKVDVSVARNFELQQNYPNPFNPSTKIQFSIPASGNVTLKIYNTIGKEVATLVNKALPQGSYTIQWKADNMPSGLYIYKLQCGSYSESKKMLLLK